MLSLFLAILGFHWVGDFVLQTHWQATNKSKRCDALARHVATYTATMFVGAWVTFLFSSHGPWVVLWFALVTGAVHFVTDYHTSRMTARLHEVGKHHDFFVVIGLDQFLHQIALALAVWFFFGG